MPNIEIKILKKDENFAQETVETDGFLILYLENNKIKMKGQMDIRTLTPVLTKIILEKMTPR